ncbi:hypothetical protein ED92_11020 [Amycolatopsis sp. MJM2582]|uniref:hypothetical protein n=1 Tax=Amycolatopsis sp. MJM2582 TaxID=1427749 RepID=UPI000501FE66|nr:hypothetical protein [Amycolatopsis sp. MJM2582]KFZ80845.1 hypothetical protein ED92_11020 [Amycolatopsis sp. MJM2582]
MSTPDDLYQRTLADIPDGACRMLVAYSRARLTHVEPIAHLLDQDRVVVTHHADGGVTIVWDAYNGHVAAEMFRLTMNMVFTGTDLLRDPPEQFYAHPDGWCPACAEAVLDGPPVWGIWLSQAWERSHVRAELQAGQPRTVARFANRVLAGQVMRSYLAALRRDRQRRRPALPVEILALDRDPRRAPRYRPDWVSEDSQLWLWHKDPTASPAARRHGGWPDEVWQFPQDGHAAEAVGQIVVVTGTEFAARAREEDRDTERRGPARRETRRTGEQVTTLDGYTIVWHREQDTDVEGYLKSILDPRSSEPARRIRADGHQERLDGAPRGLTVYGTNQFNRPSFAAAAAITPQYAYLLDGIKQSRGITVGG